MDAHLDAPWRDLERTGRKAVRESESMFWVFAGVRYNG